MKILIIDDEFNMADMVKDFFLSKGDTAVVCTDGISGYSKAASEKFDAIVLDVMLPGMDGFEILKKLREKGNLTPVLMLTARSALEDKLDGFSKGAQDYLTKPFEIEELYARIRVLGMKAMGGDKAYVSNEKASNSMAFGGTSLSALSRDLSCSATGKKVLLPTKEYLLMELFLNNKEQILSKEQITEHIWGYESDAEYNHEEVYISFLRKKLKFIGSDLMIETIRGAGYRLRKEG